MISIKIHIVQQGDTLSTIMKQYNITKQSIAEANPHIANVALLMAGMKIKITSKAKVLHHPSTASIERNKLAKERKTIKKEVYVRRAYVHERPFQKNMNYDQNWNSFQFELISSSDFSAYHSQDRCRHCRQPHYYITY